MAYSEQTVSAVTDIPALIAAFANARGWTVSGNQITRPGGGRTFEISASITGTNNRQHRVFVKDAAAPTTRGCWSQMPWVNGVSGNPVILTPTKVHLFGNDDPWDEEPWIACVIECGYNHYRHIYIGNIAKIGNYTGGEVISANTFQYLYSGSSGSWHYESDENQYLFSCRHERTGAAVDAVGGANIVHADNANPWRLFNGPASTNSQTSFNGTEILGGAMDAINSGLVFRGVSDFAGSNILVPVNLYVPDSTNFGSDVRFRPVGFAPGVRMIDMRGIDPGESIEVGNENWRVFPEFSKRTATSVGYGTSRPDGGAGGYYPSYETSYLVGLAYPEG
jgi:hypothetical protein